MCTKTTVETTVIRCSSERQGLRLFTPRSTGREDKKIFPRSKVKTAYSSLFRCFVLLESDLSFLLTQFARGLHLVTRRWRATAHSRAHDPTHSCGRLDVHRSEPNRNS